MKLIIFVLHILFLDLALSISITLKDGNNMVFNSSMRRESISVSLSSQGKLHSSFQMQSELLSPLKNRHKLIHGQSRIQFDPEIKEQLINFNDFDGTQYWLALKHLVKFKKQNSDVNFIGMRLIDNQDIHDYLLPTFPQPFSFLKLGTIYRCQNVVVSLTKQDDRFDISVFSKSGSKSWKEVPGKWSWNWAKIQENGYDFGRFIRQANNENIKIALKSDSYCEFNPMELEHSTNDGLKRCSYVSLDQVLQNSSQLKLIVKEQL